MKRTLVLIGIILIAGSACKKSDSLKPEARGSLINVEERNHLSVAQVIENVDKLSLTGTAQHGVTLYRITYRTACDGKPLNTQGIVMVPDEVDSVYLIAYFHGTQLPVKLGNLYNPAHAIPSNYNGGKTDFGEIRNIGLSWASAGYTVFMPDYIGFGNTSGEEHPYLDFPEMFKADIDGLLATKKFISGKGIFYDNRVFLAGASQGAGASLSAHKYIQENYSSQFTVVANSGYAGPYNFSRFVDEMLSKQHDDLNIINIFSWGLYALNKYSATPRPTDQIFSYPVYDQYSAIFPPSKKPAEILNSFFVSKIMDGSDLGFRKLIKDNTFSEGWKPVGKVFLYHGDADNVVPYFNSVDALNGLTADGGDIKLYTYPGEGHITNLGEYIATTIRDFNLLK